MIIGVFNYITSFDISWHRLLRLTVRSERIRSVFLPCNYAANASQFTEQEVKRLFLFTTHHSPFTMDHSPL